MWSGFGHADISDAPVVVVAAEGVVAIFGREATRGDGGKVCEADADTGVAVTQTGVASAGALAGCCQVTAVSDVEDSEEAPCFHAQGARAPTTNTSAEAANNLKDIA